MEYLIDHAEALNNLSATVLLAAIVVLIGYFYRRDIIRERKNHKEDNLWRRDNQKTLMAIIEKDIESRDSNAEAMSDLATSIAGLSQWLKAKLG